MISSSPCHRFTTFKIRYTTMTSFQRHRIYYLLLVALVAMGSYVIFISFSTAAYPFNVPRTYVVDPVPARRDLARKVLKIQREIEFQAGFDNKVYAAWAQGLLAIVAELDPRVTTAEENRNRLQTQTADDPEPLVHETLNVCPEVYKGRQYDPTCNHNFVELPCNAKKFKEVLTVLISAKGWESRRIEFVIRNIRKHYDIDIMVLTFGNSPRSLNGEGVSVKMFEADTLESSALNKAIPVIGTPYTFIVHSLVHFNAQSPLERLVRVLEDINEVSVASGAYRDDGGYWRRGCLQVIAENYELKYIRGYEHSYHECMYCDDVLGPFVAETDFLKKFPLTENMDGAVMYRDWFLNVRLSGRLVVSCPDVMFYVESEPIVSDSDWLIISQKWALQHILSFTGDDHEFSCEDAQISCVNTMKTVSSFLLPPCCRKMIRKELGFVQDCAEELGLYYELQAGSLLGAVKMDGILPWDFDTDIITDCKDEDIWQTKGFACLAKKGCSSKFQGGHYWIAVCELSIIDISCRNNRTINLPIELRQIATQAVVDGRWTKVTSNPGRIVRNNYGREYLKHAVHWRYSTNSSSPKDDGTGQIPGLWSVCAEPAFHSCLDRFPVDGNLRFKDSVCRSP